MSRAVLWDVLQLLWFFFMLLCLAMVLYCVGFIVRYFGLFWGMIFTLFCVHGVVYVIVLGTGVMSARMNPLQFCSLTMCPCLLGNDLFLVWRTTMFVNAGIFNL